MTTIKQFTNEIEERVIEGQCKFDSVFDGFYFDYDDDTDCLCVVNDGKFVICMDGCGEAWMAVDRNANEKEQAVIKRLNELYQRKIEYMEEIF